jgi:uncharacterized protein
MPARIPLRFFVVTFAWSWILWAPLVLAGLGVFPLDEELHSLLTLPVIMLGAFGPAVGACIAVWTLEGRAALGTFLRRFLSLRFGWKAYFAMFAVLGGVNAVAWYLPELWGLDRPPMLLPSAFVFPIWWLLMTFLGGGQEEVGWRGYILEPLEARFGLWRGNVVLALVWTAWHGPLWFIPGSTQATMPLAAFALGTIGTSFFFSWVMKAAGGRPMAGLMAHGAWNAFIPLFPTVATADDPSQVRWWLHQVLLLVVGAAFLLRVVRARRSGGGPSAVPSARAASSSTPPASCRKRAPAAEPPHHTGQPT